MDAHKELLKSARRVVRMKHDPHYKSRRPITANQHTSISILRAKRFLTATLVFLMFVSVRDLYAQGPGSSTASRSSSSYVEPIGVPLAPGIYLANFMLLYFSNPEIAANMPAYMAALPQEVYQCLVENPKGCVYADMEPYFAKQALVIGGSRNKNTFWPSACQIEPRWTTLAAPEYRQPNEIHQPLGRKNADRLARLLFMDQGMILDDKEYKCMTGIDPVSDEYGRDTIRACLADLTNSKGNATTPLSSYGLAVSDQGDVRSNCAPDAPCLVFNQLARDGSLLNIADQCGFEEKLPLLMGPESETPFLQLLLEGVACQKVWGPDNGRPCIIETGNPGSGGQSKKK